MEAGYTHRQSAGRSYNEGGPAMDLEEKPRPPRQAPSGADEDILGQAERSSSTTTPPASRAASKKKKPKSTRKRLKAPDSDVEGSGETQNGAADKVEQTYYQRELTSFLIENPVMKTLRPKMSNTPQGPATSPIKTSNTIEAVKILMRTMKEAGIEPKHFDANVLFDVEPAAVQDATATLHKLLAPLTSSKMPKDTPKLTSFRRPEYQTSSSQYASATSEAGSDNSVDLQRMTLGPSGSSIRHERIPNASQNQPGTAYAPLSSARMHTFFNAAMERFLKEKQTVRTQPMIQPQIDPQGMRDVEMDGYQDEFDPDDLSIDTPRPTLVASAGVSSGNKASAGVAAPRIRVSAISELKELSGKENEEDRARSRLGKVKSAFVRDQALDSEKCWSLTAESLHAKQLEGSAGNVPNAILRTRRIRCKTPLEYLHRLNVAGLRERLQVKDGPEAIRQEHVEHFIETLDDRDLAAQMANADALEDTLRARQLAKARQGKEHAGSNRFRQKAAMTLHAAPPKTARVVQAVRMTSDSSESESDSGGKRSEDEFRQIYIAAFAGRDSQETRDPHHIT
ncbi:Hypothetical protein PHPALM_14617 [Phytophthora palmivora]|uniref:Uncharacterized protein n=1 Tax=Phytophthora palmivora TaxID=4796 RepID=A0A2P4XU87_9STRA|nr:Hypothetical protein PHPALM_14617 [Phytophthora palmivora]